MKALVRSCHEVALCTFVRIIWSPALCTGAVAPVANIRVVDGQGIVRGAVAHALPENSVFCGYLKIFVVSFIFITGQAVFRVILLFA